MGRRNLSMLRVGRCMAFVAAAALLLPFTILLMLADQQYIQGYSSKRLFYQESDFYKLNGSYYAPTPVPTTTLIRNQVLSGHGCFGRYLHRVAGREPTPECHHCGCAEDTARHTVEVCPAWAGERATLVAVVGPDLTLPALVRAMLGSVRAWSAYILENSTHEEGLLSREKFLETSLRMDTRRDYLREQCSALGLDDSKAYAWEYLINRQYHVIWCNVFKAASTSWMYNFNLMANYTAAYLDKTKAVPLELARKKYARPTVEMIKKAQTDSITFIIVRHPLERLASAYKDKIVHAWPKSFHEKMGHRIIMKYRKKDSGIKEKYPLFEEFVAYVLDEARAKRTLDMHWTPYTAFCTPCKFNLDVIIKFETLDEDQRFLIQLARLQDVVKPEWKNSGKGAKTQSTINQLYSRLTRQQLDGLYKLYKHDFLLFNYSIEKYYKLIDESFG